MATPTAPAPQPPARAAKPYKGMAMEGIIAAWYTRIRAKDDEITPLVHEVCERLPAGSALLEVAPGPGYLAIELARTGRYQITGLDISHSSVRIAREKAAAAGVAVDFQHGNAAAMPFPAGSFDFVLCRAAFKNFTEPVQAVREMHRVLRPGGTALISDLRGDARQADIDRHVGQMGLNAVNAWLTRWTFAHILLKNAYTATSIRQVVAQTEFAGCTIDESDIAMAVWLHR
jgi:ubiquinone/menaquinone biosynthesis C-methylase UbiE